MKRWEYRHEYIAIFPPPREEDPNGDIRSQMLQDTLNRYGDAGWELVAISPGLLDGDYVDGYAVFKQKLKV